METLKERERERLKIRVLVDRTMSWSITEKEVEDLIQQCWDAQVLRGNLSVSVCCT
jgi:hypothetical protein